MTHMAVLSRSLGGSGGAFPGRATGRSGRGGRRVFVPGDRPGRGGAGRTARSSSRRRRVGGPWQEFGPVAGNDSLGELVGSVVGQRADLQPAGRQDVQLPGHVYLAPAPLRCLRRNQSSCSIHPTGEKFGFDACASDRVRGRHLRRIRVPVSSRTDCRLAQTVIRRFRAVIGQRSMI